VKSPIIRAAGGSKHVGAPSRRWSSALLGTLVSVGCVVALFITVDLDQVGEALTHATLWPLGVSVALTAITVACRVWRWQALLMPEERSNFWPAVEATLIGYLFIAILPGRVGELSRASLLGRTQGTSTGRAFGTIAVEKLYDVAALFVMLGALSVVVPIPAWARAAALTVGSGFAAFLLAFGAATAARGSLVAWVQRAIDPIRYLGGRKVSVLVSGILGAASSLRSPRLVVTQVLASIVLWGLAIGQTYLGTIAFDVGTGWDAATFMLVTTNLGMTVPSAPASLGVYHGITVLSLEAFGVDREVALALAIGVHALGFGTLAGSGALCLALGILRRRFGIADLWQWRS
jgi:uncharacterized protein (TIRG00374 family)